jgi:hypothetical protein
MRKLPKRPGRPKGCTANAYRKLLICVKYFIESEDRSFPYSDQEIGEHFDRNAITAGRWRNELGFDIAAKRLEQYKLEDSA